jgi:hypothetical protein
MLIIRPTDKIEERQLSRVRTTASGSLAMILSRIWTALPGRCAPCSEIANGAERQMKA